MSHVHDWPPEVEEEAQKFHVEDDPSAVETKPQQNRENRELTQEAAELHKDIESLNELLKNPELDKETRDYAFQTVALIHNRLRKIESSKYEGYRPEQLFISYSHKDIELVRAANDVLKNKGVDTWRDEEKITNASVSRKRQFDTSKRPQDFLKLAVDVYRKVQEQSDSHLSGNFIREIQIKGIPGSSEMAVVLTVNAMKKFDQIKKEIEGAKGKAKIIPVLVGTPAQRAEIARSLDSEGVGWILNDPKNPPIELKEGVSGKEMADVLFNEVQNRATETNRARVKEVQDGKDVQENLGIKAKNAEEQQIIDALKKINADVDKLQKSGSKENLDQIPALNRDLDATIDGHYRNFQPEKVNIISSSTNPEFSAKIENALKTRGIGSEKGFNEQIEYSVFVITDADLQNGLSKEAKEQIKKFLEIAKTDPDKVEVVPIFVGVKDFALLRKELDKDGLGDFLDNLAITTESSADIDQLTSDAVEFMKRCQRAKHAPNMYDKDYNQQLGGENIDANVEVARKIPTVEMSQEQFENETKSDPEFAELADFTASLFKEIATDPKFVKFVEESGVGEGYQDVIEALTGESLEGESRTELERVVIGAKGALKFAKTYVKIDSGAIAADVPKIVLHLVENGPETADRVLEIAEQYYSNPKYDKIFEKNDQYSEMRAKKLQAIRQHRAALKPLIKHKELVMKIVNRVIESEKEDQENQEEQTSQEQPVAT